MNEKYQRLLLLKKNYKWLQKNAIRYVIVAYFIIVYFFVLKNKEIFAYKNKKNEIEDKIDLKYIHNLKKVVYSANFGKYDSKKNVNRQKGYDYFIFVDENDELYFNSNWSTILISEEFKKLNMSIKKKQRYMKTHPHLLFPKYDLSIYIDSNFEIIGNLDEFLVRILTHNHSMYMLEHPERNKIYQEFKLVEILKKENKNMLRIIKERYKKTKFPDENGLIEGCLIVRKHNDKDCINVMEEWFKEINSYSHRDQLSFNYVLWKTRKKIKYLSKKFCFKYFYGNYAHKKK